jgi:hypothetical protein
MEAPPENFAYTLLLSPNFSKPDALAVIDVKPGSPTYSQIVHTVTMPHKGDEFHHFGWNACSSSLSPLTGHAFVEGAEVMANVSPNGGLELAKEYWISFPNGYRAHQIRLDGGDCSTDSFCYPSV